MAFSRVCIAKLGLISIGFLAAGETLAATGLSRSLFSITGEPPAGLANESEFGVILTSGNTSSQSIHIKQQTSYRWPVETVMARARFLEANANGNLNAKNWGTDFRYERRLIPKLGAYAGQSLEADIFAGYSQRYASDLGVRKVWWRSETTTGASEVGYQYQMENRRVGPRNYRQIVRLFAEAVYSFNPKVSASASVEVLPNVRKSSDWLLNGEIELRAELTRVFALKTAYGLKYTHLPAAPGLKATDTTLTTSLVARF